MKKKGLLLYTGGRIGMKDSGHGYVPDPDFVEKVNQLPELRHVSMQEFEFICLSPLLAKLYYLLSKKEYSLEDVKRKIRENLRGEVSLPPES